MIKRNKSKIIMIQSEITIKIKINRIFRYPIIIIIIVIVKNFILIMENKSISVIISSIKDNKTIKDKVGIFK